MGRGPGLVLLMLVVLGLAGCAATSRPGSSPPPSPRVRCLADPTETGPRPLVFLFCIETP
jgi:hypothetical protein